jgi:plastocyanin
MFATRAWFRQGWYLLSGLAILFSIGLTAGAVFAGRLSDTTAGLAQSNSQNPSCPPDTRQVSIVDNAFDPQFLTIYPDTTVQWTNIDSRIHTTTSDSALWDSGPLDSGQSFSFTFTAPGSYPYHCGIHPAMTGTITVLEGCPPAATDTPGPTNTPTSVNTPIPTNTPTFTDTPVNGATATPTCPPNVPVQPVSIQDTEFVPDPVTVGVGATVHWTNESSRERPHTTTSSNGLWDSGSLSPGQSFDFTFNTPGTYTYLCTLHGFTGTIIVTSNCPPTLTPISSPTYTSIPADTYTATPSPASSATSTPICPPSLPLQPVSIQDAAFVPDPVTVGAGTTVHWTNDSERGRQHTTTSSNGLWDSGPLEVGQSFDFTFNTPGSYGYYDAFRGFTGTIVVVSNCPPTVTPTFTPAPAGVINGHLTWQNVVAANRPLVTGTLALCVSGSPQTFSFSTDTNGNFAIGTGLPDGTYNWRIKGGRHLSNSSPTDGGALVISGGQATQEFGTHKGGDSRSDNIVNTLDFSDLKFRFGQAGNYPADFDYNQVVNTSDFNILKGNFGQAGHSITCP